MRTDIAGRVVENEDLVNFPNWLTLEFRIADEDWFNPGTVKLLSYRQELDLRRGVLLRTISFEDGRGRRSTLKERRLVSMDDMHLGALELALTAENWAAKVTVRSAIDGRVVNAGAKLYRKFNNKHLEVLAGEVVDEDGVYLLVRTCQSQVYVAQAARTQAYVDGQLREGPRRVIDEPGYIGQEMVIDLRQGETWRWKSSPLSIRLEIRPSRSAGWRRARRSRVQVASTPWWQSMSWPGNTCGAASTCTCGQPAPRSR